MTNPENGQKEVDDVSGVETTQHEWDGIKELDNPLPRWWLWIFYASVAWSLVFYVLYPSIPFVNSYWAGTTGQSDRVDVKDDMDLLRFERAIFGAQLDAATLEEIRSTPELLEFALAAGTSAFGDNCATCHGRGAQGFPGYPNLADDYWLWGGTLDEIHTTISNGIRYDHPETRYSIMPSFLADGILDENQISDLTEYVVALSGGDADTEATRRARPLYVQNCAVCHGAGGRGDQNQGAPNLTDADWLYGGDREAISSTISFSRFGVMPAWEDRLDATTIRALAIWVHSRGGGEEETQ